MQHNVGDWDRTMRLVVGAAAVVAALAVPLPKSWKWSLLAIGASELLTATTRFCPVNQALGIDTNELGPKETAREVLQNVRVLAE